MKKEENWFFRLCKNEKTLKGFLQILVVIFAILISITVLILLIIKPETYAQQLIPLLTFILGALLGGIGAYLWGKKK